MIDNQLTKHREILDFHLDSANDASSATIFIGLFNAVRYLDPIKKFLDSAAGNIKILLVDNASEDDTWSQILDWAPQTTSPITLVRNPVNLGANGSFFANLDLISTPWVITIHQDDHYHQDHIETLLAEIEKGSNNCVAICTDMGSRTEFGESTGAVPRPAWMFDKKLDPATLFLSNLRLHNLLTPAGAFRVSALRQISVPLHSTAMPDTEWVLQLVTHGAVTFCRKITMDYTENPLSESHAIDPLEKQIGTFTSLIRTFTSPSFIDLCRGISIEKQSGFCLGVLSGIQIRLKDENFSNLVKLIASENMAMAWNYGEGHSRNFIAEYYKNADSYRIPEMMARLSHFYGAQKESIFLAKENRSRVSLDVKSKFQSNLRRVVFRLLSFVPYSLRRQFAKFILKTWSTGNIENPWNYDWQNYK